MVRSNREDSLNFDVLNQESLNAISLSESAYNVLVCLAEGYKYVQIAQKLDISLDSVRYYVKEIYRKLGVKNKGAAVGMFLRKEIEINTRLRERKNILKVNTKERFVENY